MFLGRSSSFGSIETFFSGKLPQVYDIVFSINGLAALGLCLSLIILLPSLVLVRFLFAFGLTLAISGSGFSGLV